MWVGIGRKKGSVSVVCIRYQTLWTLSPFNFLFSSYSSFFFSFLAQISKRSLLFFFFSLSVSQYFFWLITDLTLVGSFLIIRSLHLYIYIYNLNAPYAFKFQSYQLLTFDGFKVFSFFSLWVFLFLFWRINLLFLLFHIKFDCLLMNIKLVNYLVLGFTQWLLNYNLDMDNQFIC